MLREFDLAAGSLVTDGFYLPEGKSGTAWLDHDTLLLSSALGEGMATHSGYARTVRLWQRGANPFAAPVIFETRAESMSVEADVDRDGADETIDFVERIGFFDATVWIGDRTGPKTRLELPTDAALERHRGWLAVKRRSPWTIGGETHAPDTVLGISFPAFQAGDRHFTKLFEPGPRRALQGFFWCGGRLVLSVLDDLIPVFEALTPSETGWSREPITGHGEAMDELEIVQVQPNASIFMNLDEMVANSLEVCRLAVWGEPHDFVLALIHRESSEVSKGGVQKPQRMGKPHFPKH